MCGDRYGQHVLGNPPSKIFTALTWACKKAKGGKDNLWFNIARGGLRDLDCIGTTACHGFITVTKKEVMDFVAYDVEDSNLSTVGHMVMKGSKESP